jgi:hypothetical protein
MNQEIYRLCSRINALVGETDFHWDDPPLDSTEEFLAVCAHNCREGEKIEALDEESQERIRNLTSKIFTVMLQEEATEKYGSMEMSSIRQVMDDWSNRPEYRAFLVNLRQTTKLALLDSDLTEEQIDTVIKDFFDKLSQIMMEVIEELITPLQRFRQVEAHSIAMDLADMMMKEVRNADSI